MRSAWPFVRAAAGELWAAGALGLLGGVGLVVGAEVPGTIALGAVAFAGLWGGVVAGGGAKGKLVHLLSRPIDRGRILGLRVATLGAMLLVVGAIVGAVGMAFGPTESGPPLPIMFACVGVCALAGVLAGALFDSETTAVGAAFVGAVFVLAPPIFFNTSLGLSWTRLDGCLGALRWPFALALVATAVLPVAHAWTDVPGRTASASLRSVKRVAVVVVLQFGLGWAPLAVVASSPAGGEPIGWLAGPEQARVLLTGSRFEDGVEVDGVMLVDGEGQRPLFDSSSLRALTGGLSGTIESVTPSPDGASLALLVRESDRIWHVVVVRVSTGEAFDIGRSHPRTPAVWSQDGTHLLLSCSGHSFAKVYRVGEGLVSEHRCPPTVFVLLDDGHHPSATAVDHRLVETSLPVDLGGGWQGDRPFSIVTDPRPALRVFDGATRTLRTVPIAIDGDELREIVSSAWLDAGHVAVLARQDANANDGRLKRLFVIDLQGRVVADAFIFDWFGFERIEGPPEGPWLLVNRSGHVDAWARDGRLWRESVTHFGRNVELPFALDERGVAGVDRLGRTWQRPLPWAEGSR